MDNDKSKAVAEEEKQTNRVFTQSELDSFLHREVSKMKTEYDTKLKEFSGMKEEFETLKKTKLEKERAEMSELEKSKMEKADILAQMEKIQNDYLLLKKEQTVNEVLQKEEYSKLPLVYRKSIVRSDNLDEVMQSANDILELYNKDFSGLKPVEQNIGKPISSPSTFNGQAVINSQSSTDGMAHIKAKLAERIKQFNISG